MDLQTEAYFRDSPHSSQLTAVDCNAGRKQAEEMTAFLKRQFEAARSRARVSGTDITEEAFCVKLAKAFKHG